MFLSSNKSASILVAVIILFVVLAGGFSFWYWKTMTREKAPTGQEQILQEKESEECAEEGMLMCNVLGCEPCCAGLVARYVKEPMRERENKVVCVEEMVTQSRCVKCGDGLCGKGENWCICPEDCEEPKPEELELYPLGAQKQIKEEFLEVPDITFETDFDTMSGAKSKTEIIVKNYGEEVAQIYLTDDYYHPMILKQTYRNVYIGLEPDGMGGYMLYFGPPIIYRLSLEDYALTKIAPGGQINDISPNERMIAYVKFPKTEDKSLEVIVQDIESLLVVQRDIIPSQYRTAGDIVFSPNGKKIAYAAALYNPGQEVGILFITDLDSGEQKIFQTEDWGFYSVIGWRDNERVIYGVNPNRSNGGVGVMDKHIVLKIKWCLAPFFTL